MKTLGIYFISILTLISLSTDLHSQYRNQDEVNLFGFGIMAGLNTTQVDGDFVKGYNKSGFYGGISGMINFSQRSHIEIGLIYSQKGSGWGNEENGFKSTGPAVLRMDMIEIPITFKYYSKTSATSIFWEGGLAFSQLIERSLDQDFPSRLAQNIYDEMEPFFKKQELNLVFGIGVRIEKAINLGMRFTTALSHIMDKNLPPVEALLFTDLREIGILRNYGFTILVSREF